MAGPRSISCFCSLRIRGAKQGMQSAVNFFGFFLAQWCRCLRKIGARGKSASNHVPNLFLTMAWEFGANWVARASPQYDHPLPSPPALSRNRSVVFGASPGRGAGRPYRLPSTGGSLGRWLQPASRIGWMSDPPRVPGHRTLPSGRRWICRPPLDPMR
jgi:hypothetical protein